MVKIAMIQMRVIFSEAGQNLSHAEELVAQAAAQGAKICVLPECMDIGWGNPKAAQFAEPIPGITSQKLCEIARKNNVYLVSGITERDREHIYNAAVIISDSGEILSKHRKINILTGVEDVYSVGTMLSVVTTPFGRIGMNICADNAIPSLCIGHALARMGAQIILSPSAWAVKPDFNNQKTPYGEEWHIPYSYLSGLYGIPVIGVSNVGQVTDGTWKGWKAIGNSIAYDREGKLLEVLPFGENAECIKILDIEFGEPKRSGTELSEYVQSKVDERI